MTSCLRKSIGPCALGIVALCVALRADDTSPPASTPTLSQTVHNGWLRFNVVAGRARVSWSDLERLNKPFVEGDSTEQFNLDAVAGSPALQYERSTPAEVFSLTLVGNHEIHLVRSGRNDGSAIVPVRFTQLPGEPVVLTVGRDGARREYKAVNLWRLLIERPRECREHLLPLLDLLSERRLAATLDAVENELVQAAAAGEAPNLTQFRAWVTQLGDERFGRRQAAERALRAAGPAALGFLTQLDFRRLDAEQQQRVRRIVAALANETADDSPEKLAESLLGDVSVWVALLERDDAALRTAAARHLAALLGPPIEFDATASSVVRAAQIAALRSRIDREARDMDRKALVPTVD